MLTKWYKRVQEFQLIYYMPVSQYRHNKNEYKVSKKYFNESTWIWVLRIRLLPWYFPGRRTCFNINLILKLVQLSAAGLGQAQLKFDSFHPPPNFHMKSKFSFLRRITGVTGKWVSCSQSLLAARSLQLSSLHPKVAKGVKWQILAKIVIFLADLAISGS